MIRYFITLLFLAVLISCNNEASTTVKENENDTSQIQRWFDTDTLLVWDCSAEDHTKKRIFHPSDSITSALALVNGVNKTYAEVKLSFDHISNDTMYVTIPKANWLTDQAGNTGAEQYLAFAALNLLEMKGVNHINFLFEGGAHARPSTFTDLDFDDWKTDPSSAK